MHTNHYRIIIILYTHGLYVQVICVHTVDTKRPRDLRSNTTSLIHTHIDVRLRNTRGCDFTYTTLYCTRRTCSCTIDLREKYTFTPPTNAAVYTMRIMIVIYVKCTTLMVYKIRIIAVRARDTTIAAKTAVVQIMQIIQIDYTAIVYHGGHGKENRVRCATESQVIRAAMI